MLSHGIVQEQGANSSPWHYENCHLLCFRAYRCQRTPNIPFRLQTLLVNDFTWKTETENPGFFPIFQEKWEPSSTHGESRLICSQTYRTKPPLAIPKVQHLWHVGWSMVKPTVDICSLLLGPGLISEHHRSPTSQTSDGGMSSRQTTGNAAEGEDPGLLVESGKKKNLWAQNSQWAKPNPPQTEQVPVRRARALPRTRGEGRLRSTWAISYKNGGQ